MIAHHPEDCNGLLFLLSDIKDEGERIGLTNSGPSDRGIQDLAGTLPQAFHDLTDLHAAPSTLFLFFGLSFAHYRFFRVSNSHTFARPLSTFEHT